MYTIDLLSGKGVPIKSRPGGAVLVGITFAVPVILVILMLGGYLYGRIIMVTRRSFIRSYEAKITRLSEALAQLDSDAKKIKELTDCLREAARIIKLHSQWSFILSVLAEEVPKGLILERVSARTEVDVKEIPKQDELSSFTTTYQPRQVVRIHLLGKSNPDSDQAVVQFRQRLQERSGLIPRVDNVSADEQKAQVRYEIRCVLEGQELLGPL
jgi:uncharacterized protein YcaQ